MTTLMMIGISLAVGGFVFVVITAVGFRFTRGLSTITMMAMMDETENDSEPAVV